MQVKKKIDPIVLCDGQLNTNYAAFIAFGCTPPFCLVHQIREKILTKLSGH